LLALEPLPAGCARGAPSRPEGWFSLVCMESDPIE
jgi:hypothetical protein